MGRLAGVVAVVLLPLAVAAVLLLGPARTFADMTRDMASVTGAPPWTGFLGLIGVLYWAVAGGIALFAAWDAGPQDRGFLTTLGTLQVVLALDDLFMLHEYVVPSLGVPETAIKVAYAAVGIGFVVGYRRRMAGVAGLVFLGAGACLLLSLIVDGLSNRGDTSAALEGALKFVGTAGMLVATVSWSRAAR